MIHPSQLRELRKRLGISQAKLARLAGVSQSLIARLERGKADTKLSTYLRIISVLDSLRSRSRVAAEIMHSPVIWVEPQAKLSQVIKIMESHGISQLPVIQDGIQMGSITEGRILKLILEKPGLDLSQIQVSSIMEPPFPTIPPETELLSVSRMLEHHPAVLIHSQGKILGIITKQDVMVAVARERYPG